MNRKQRTEVLVHCDKNFLDKWKELIELKYSINILEKPELSLVMVKMRESAKNSLFYLTEMLVSECRVEINGYIGIGIIQGIKLEEAYAMAIIDAMYNANLEEANDLDKEIEREKALQEKKKQKEIAAILKTKVSFETMDV